MIQIAVLGRSGFFGRRERTLTSIAHTAKVTSSTAAGAVKTRKSDGFTIDELPSTAGDKPQLASARLIAAKKWAQTPSSRGDQNSQLSWPLADGKA
jgi:hypothetical protein